VDKFVLDVGKMKDVPPLFRAVRNDKRYFASEILIEALKTEIPMLFMPTDLEVGKFLTRYLID
jgi:hypothetical protein